MGISNPLIVDVGRRAPYALKMDEDKGRLWEDLQAGNCISDRDIREQRDTLCRAEGDIEGLKYALGEVLQERSAPVASKPNRHLKSA